MTNINLENEGIRLLKKGHKGIMRAIFSRLGLFIVLILVQLGVLFGIFSWFEGVLPQVFGGTVLFEVGMVIYLLNSGMDATAKITWLIIVMIFPVFGILLFWFTKSEIGHRAMKEKIAMIIERTSNMLEQNTEVVKNLKEKDKGAATLAGYMNRNGCHPIYKGVNVEYFSSGEEKWKRMLNELEKAERFIYLEYFIVDEGTMWGKILEILAKKAKEGVDVRVMYDGSCAFSTLPYNYPKRIKKLGIKCKMFAPVIPIVSTYYNYRDHRKILIIDGKTAFTGGVNLADEYINAVEKYGHWKDAAIMIKGEAVRSFTLMFLQMWNEDKKSIIYDDFLQPLNSSEPLELNENSRGSKGEGFVIPYGDCPLDDELIGERVYMDILNRATEYAYIMTPYLILDGEMETALKFAAERGVDVRLILPGKPDKKGPYALAKNHYSALLQAGVKIYEYTPGFIHSKVFLSDDQEAVVGTINLDYRSLYHHFECALWMFETECIKKIKEDFQETFPLCRQINEDNIWDGFEDYEFMGWILKAVAPLL